MSSLQTESCEIRLFFLSNNGSLVLNLGAIQAFRVSSGMKEPSTHLMKMFVRGV